MEEDGLYMKSGGSEKEGCLGVWRVIRSVEGVSFLVAVFVTSMLALGVSDLGSFSDEGVAYYSSLYGGVILVVVWQSLSLSSVKEEIGDFLFMAGIFTALALPIAMMLFSLGSGLATFMFWWNLMVWNVLLIFAWGSNQEKQLDGLETLIIGVGITSGFTAFYVTFGEMSIAPYAGKVVEGLYVFDILVDVRLFLLGLLIALIGGAAVYKALQLPQPDIKKMNPWVVPKVKQKGLVGAALAPMMEITSIFLMALNAVADLFWKALKITAIFFRQVGAEIYEILADLANELIAWRYMLRFSIEFSIAVILILLVENTLPYFWGYVVAADWSSELRELMIVSLYSSGLLLGVWMSGCILVSEDLSGFIGETDKMGKAVVTALAWILMMFWVSGGVLYCFRYIGMNLPGFDGPGLYSLVLLFLVVSGIVHTYIARTKESELGSRLD